MQKYRSTKSYIIGAFILILNMSKPKKFTNRNNNQEVFFNSDNSDSNSSSKSIVAKSDTVSPKKINLNKVIHQKLETHKDEIIAKYTKLKLLISEYLSQIEEGHGTKYFYKENKDMFRAAIRKTSIAAIALIAEPQKKSLLGSTVVAISTKSRGDVPPTALYDLPINQVFELDLFLNDILNYLTKIV